MNKIKIIIVLALVCLAGAVKAQTYGTGTTIAGGTNLALVQVTVGTGLTNYLNAYMPTKSALVSGITSTNETLVGQVGIQIPPGTPLMPGTTNVYLFASFTNSFAAGTNGGSFATNNLYFTSQMPFPVYFNWSIGAFTNSVFMP